MMEFAMRSGSPLLAEIPLFKHPETPLFYRVFGLLFVLL